MTYLHLMFDARQTIFANGAPAESFYSGCRRSVAFRETPSADLLTCSRSFARWMADTLSD